MRSVVVSVDSSFLVSGGEDKRVIIFNVETAVAIRELCGHEGIVNGVVLSLDGKLSASCSDDKTVRIWASIVAAVYTF